MLEYLEQNRQQLIVRQSSLDRAVEIMIAGSLIKELNNPEKIFDVIKQLNWLVNELESIVRNPRVQP